jgi:gliding motility-associated-like protein
MFSFNPTLMYKYFLLYIFLFSFSVLQAQKEWVNWNSSAGGVTFKSGNGVVFADVPNNLKQPDYTGDRAYSYNDPLTGNMFFLTDGKTIWNRNYKCILNPKLDSLISCDNDFYKIQIVPFTHDPSKFYLFHLYSAKGFVSQMDIGSAKGCADQNLSNLYYSVLQMNNDSGKLITRNIPILKSPLDRVTLIKHANKKDTWVIAHPWDSAYYAAFLVTDAMVNQPVISVIGPPAFLAWPNIAGSITASPDGDMIATSSSNSTVEIYNFNNRTGIFSNYRTINFHSEIVSSLCFSPDNTKLYIAVSDVKECDNYSKIYQVDFNEHSLNRSLFMIKKYPRRRILKLSKAPDNKIWIKVNRHFDVIMYPNQPKNASVIKERYLRPKALVQFPNIVNDYIKQPAEQPIQKLNLPDTLKVCFGKAKLDVEAGYESYIWNTGDTGHSIVVTKPGSYIVLAGKKRFVKPDAYGYVYVESTAAELFQDKDMLLCPKTLHALTIPQNITNIRWMDGDTSHIKPVQQGLYKLTGIDDKGCTVWDSVCVSVHNYPMVSFGNDTTLCSLQTLQLKMPSYSDSTNLRNIKSSVYQWQDSSTKNLFTVTKPGIYAGSISYDGCTVRDTIQVSYIPMPKVDFGKDTSLCSGDSLKLFVEPFNVDYLWSNGNTSNTITAKTTEKYWVKVSQQFCVNTDTILVNFKSLPVISLQNDTVMCTKTPFTLSPSTNPSYKYKWQNGDTTDKFVVTKTGSYSVTANLNGCYVSDSVWIEMISKPSVKLFDTILCKGEQLLLNPGASEHDTVLWQDQSSQHTFLVTNPGIYSVEVSNKCGADFKAITVIQKLCNLIMPTAFTPNNDNLNDLFRLKHPNIVKAIHLSVYNRMGQKIFETTDPYKGWNGTINGIAQPIGTYVWQMNYTDINNNKAFSSGYVVLIR